MNDLTYGVIGFGMGFIFMLGLEVMGTNLDVEMCEKRNAPFQCKEVLMVMDYRND